MRFVLAILVAVQALGFSAFAQTASQNVIDFFNQKNYEKAADYIPTAIPEKKNDAGFMLKCGDIYMEINKADSALIMYNKAGDIGGSKLEVMRKKGLALSSLKRHVEAIDILKKAIKEDKSDINNDLTLGRIYLAADSLSQAELAITKAREKDKKNPLAYLALGDLYFKRGVYELARANYEEALKLDENLTDARKNLATSYYWLGNSEIDKDLANELFSRSLEEWVKVTKKDPLDAKAFFEAGKICFFAKKYSNAVEFLDKYVAMRPKGILGRWYLAQCLEIYGNADTSSYRKALEHLPIVAAEMDSVKKKANLMIARCFFNIKEYNNSIAQFKSVMKDTTLSSEDYSSYGNAYFAIKDTLNAFKVWEEASDKYPADNCKKLDNMGYFYNKMALYGDAIRVLKKRLAIGQCSGNKDHIAYYFIGHSYLFSQKPDSSIYYFDMAFKTDKTMLMAKVYEGDALTNMRLIDSAKTTFRTVIETGKTDSTSSAKFAVNQAFLKLCQMDMETKDWKSLITITTEWTVVVPESEYGYLYLAVAYQNAEKTQLACKNYRKVLQINPNNQTAKKYLASLQANGGCGE